MTQKTWLIVGALAVVAMIVGLVISLRGDDPPAYTGPRETPAAATPATPPAAPSDGAPRAAAPPPTPVAPEVVRPTPQPPVAEDDEDERPAVRDHRGGGPTGTPSPIASTSIASVRQALNQQIKGCGDAVAGVKRPIRVIAHAVLRAAGGRISAHEVEITSVDRLPPEITDCVRRAYEGLSTDAQGTQPDGEDKVHMPWTLP
jgi:hypothetical protein